MAYMFNEEQKHTGYTCDLTGEQIERNEHTKWFEFAETKDHDMTQYDVVTCMSCQQDFTQKALPLMRWSLEYDRHNLYQFYCGECGDSFGIFRLRNHAHGMMVGHEMKDAEFIIPHMMRAPEHLPAYTDGLRYRMEKWFGQRETARTLKFNLFDMYRDDYGMWCIKDEEDEQGTYIDADLFVALGFNQFMDFFTANFTTTQCEFKQSYFGYGTTYRRKIEPSPYFNYEVTVYDWRADDDGIGGYNSPLMFTISQRGNYYDGQDITVLCGQSSSGSDDSWNNNDSFNAFELFSALVKHMHIRNDFEGY